ncbi:lamin-like protein [Quillaja saponaria]|uniref:Lamin-like protein n=1 Tax=Quillaja saponaria TaxID=32244 RepID=A0AAD7Q480_QUISA|nr:lamin-like protein [Quillaja saponaria]
MEGLRKGILLSSPAMVFLVLLCAVLVMLPEASATRWIVGANMGWTTNVNYTIWAKDKHFYNGDWLYFVYDRNQMNVLEVNKTDYEMCNADHPLHNWTTKAGRDVAPLNVTRHYYFISGKGFCYGGMKLSHSCRKSTTTTFIFPCQKWSSKSKLLKPDSSVSSCFCHWCSMGYISPVGSTRLIFEIQYFHEDTQFVTRKFLDQFLKGNFLFTIVF